MLTNNFLKTHQQLQSDKLLLPKREFVTYALYALIAVALLYLFVDPAAPSSSSSTTPSLAAPWSLQEDHVPPPPSPPPTYYHQGHERSSRNAAAAVSSSSPAPSPASCDYSDGEWVPDPRPPPYNGTACEAIKDGRSCMANGRSDTGYIHWRWQPRRCDLPDFSPADFLRWLTNKHMAFVGDSLARNQAESLMCLLSSSSPAELVHRDSDGRFRRWVFRDYNATVSIFWSPFLVRGAEKSERDGVRYNQIFLDEFDERWMSELAGIDAAVVSVGQWFKIPSVYYHGEGGSRVVGGCYGCAPELNHTETSFFSVFRDVVKRTLAEVARRHENGAGGKVVALTTFSPSHFEGEWNKGAPCTLTTRPYRKGEKEVGYTEAEMRRIVVEEAAEAAAGTEVRFVAVDVTALANMRPDGHPGPYMRKNPFAAAAADGKPVQHDCLHWCMPGPVDTFNQILLQTILR